MCVALAVIGTGLAIGGMLANNAARAEQREADRRAGRAKARELRYLAEVTDEQIEDVQKAGDINRELITEDASRTAWANEVEGRKVAGAQLAAAAASGVGGGSVTTQALQIDTANLTERNEMYIRYNANKQKWLDKKEEQAKVKNLRHQAVMYRMGANNAASGNYDSTVGDISSFIDTAGRVVNIWK